LAWALKDFRIKATGTQSLANAQVAAGGIATDQFNPFTLESKLHKGLFSAGELLDIDGDCGGFNLQWAWSSGLLAAESACNSIE
ncbi:MAG: NAD(P)/FAD-dependent oxidoreductase, partial [Clostridia bacterium]|nr:NAD(P)/FAD-dependent oxidoreductase [Clostridia bacterium]